MNKKTLKKMLLKNIDTYLDGIEELYYRYFQEHMDNEFYGDTPRITDFEEISDELDKLNDKLDKINE